MTNASILAIMLALRAGQPVPSHPETEDERKQRYEEIAEDLGAQRQELLPGFNRDESIMLVLAVAYHETAFVKDADVGPCYRGIDGKSPRCDGGRAKCLMQLHVKDWPERRECFARGIEAMRRSLATCKENPPNERLAMLSGSCNRGRKGSREIFDIFKRIRSIHNQQSAQAKAEARKEAKSK